MLKGRSICLRLVRQGDLEQITTLMSDVYARGDHFPLMLRSEVAVRQRYEKDGMWGDESGTMLIVDAEDDRVLGSISQFKGIHYYDCVEVGYILYRAADRGKGYATEAVRLLTRYLFDSMKICRIQIQAEPGNVGSVRVAEKCGYRFEGIARAAFISKGKPCDIGVYAITRADFEEL